MKIRQVSVFIENKVGRVMEITEVLGENKINLRALSLADTSDFGILRMIVDKTDQAIQELRDEGFIVKETDVVAVVDLVRTSRRAGQGRHGDQAHGKDCHRAAAIESLLRMVPPFESASPDGRFCQSSLS